MAFARVKRKVNPDDTPGKLKTRIVADGRQEDSSIYAPDPLDTYAPTISMTLLLLMLGIFAKDDMHVSTGDVPGAFLNADLGDADELKDLSHVMIQDKVASKYMCEVDPSYKEYVRKDGTILVKLKKALYGLIEALKRWNVHIADLLKQFGFQQHPLEPCVFVYKGDDGVCYLLLYVDDIFIGCTNAALLERVKAYISSHFPGFNWRDSNQHDCVGLEIDLAEPGVAKLSMTGYIKDLLETTGTIGYADSPVGPHLFDVRPDEEAELLDMAAAKSFHTVVMKCHYLDKRMRFDILTAVAGLATRVQNPDLDDKLKLNRLLCYLNKTKEQVLKICIDHYPDHGLHRRFVRCPL